MPDMEDSDSWGQWRRHVLLEMEAQRKSLETLMITINDLKSTEIAQIKTELALLKYKSSLFGAVGSGLVIALYLLIEVLKK